MTVWASRATTGADAGEEVSFHLTRPPIGVATNALVFASPHSGRLYPQRLMEASRLGKDAIRRSEDAYVDRLIAAAPQHGTPVLAARLARAWLDLNRDAWELDSTMFEDELPAYARGRSSRVAAGLGCIARTVGEGEEIYHRKLTFAEARARIESVHLPYHAALRDLVTQATLTRGAAVLIDWHSMPSASTRQGGGGSGCDVVLGDRFGAACAPGVSRLVETTLRAMGYRVARNAPYAGGYTTEHYGQPAKRVHALQVEINRGLYMNEATLAPSSGFHPLRENLERLFAVLAATDWNGF